MGFGSDPTSEYVGIESKGYLAATDDLPNHVTDMAGRSMTVSTWRCDRCGHEQEVGFPEANSAERFPDCESCGGIGPWRFVSAR